CTASSAKKPISSSRSLRSQALQNSLTNLMLSMFLPPLGLFVVQIEAVFILVIAEQFRKTPPVHDSLKQAFRPFVRQEHRKMFKHDFLGKRAIFLPAQQPDEVIEQAELL